MPLFKKIKNEDFEIALWRIEEPLSFFESEFESHPVIKNENKKLQWFATRFLVREILGKQAEVLNDEIGKPFVNNASHNISLSHTPKFVAVMASKKNIVGIDLEPVHEKVKRIASKFLLEDELKLISEEQKTEKLILYWSAKRSVV